jgi:hypothetical protein
MGMSLGRYRCWRVSSLGFISVTEGEGGNTGEAKASWLLLLLLTFAQSGIRGFLQQVNKYKSRSFQQVTSVTQNMCYFLRSGMSRISSRFMTISKHYYSPIQGVRRTDKTKFNIPNPKEFYKVGSHSGAGVRACVSAGYSTLMNKQVDIANRMHLHWRLSCLSWKPIILRDREPNSGTLHFE